METTNDDKARASARGDSLLVVGASIAANVAVAVTKFVVANLTGSTAMLAEGVHSLANCFDGGLLLLGERRARLPADEVHPFGYGRELYFWSFIVAVMFFALGAGFTLYNGVVHILHPEPLRSPKWNYVVLAASALFDGASFVVGYKTFRRRSRGASIWTAIADSKNPTLFSTVLEDTADMVGLACAFAGIFLSHLLDKPWLDGAASIAIGILLAVLAIVLLVKTHRLLIGESAGTPLLDAVRDTAANDDAVVQVAEAIAVHVGPDSVVLALRVAVRPELDGENIALRLKALERELREQHPELSQIFLDIVPTCERESTAPG